ncbi:hypothetical protein GRX01_03915 [Halobaculum sp. WSA2]|uniref:Uncharacterized protein n=1 Tax=Halobaculum saliterrae TaxID=2073113 RepID=A0A6B0SPY0_9EURY|nr:hypothetical protein [Halobaculum saliterrae]MXR40497.1 hypothetical protein [Halobaculum saliterrae]
MANYSLRLDDDLREEMREVPDMADRIRDFIEREVRNYKHDAMTEVEEFCHQVIDEYGVVGAYSLEQLNRLNQNRRYVENIEARFSGTDVDIQEARLAAKEIRDGWENLPRPTEDEVEEILETRGFYDEFYDHAVKQVREAVDSEAPVRWAYWTVLQLARTYEEDYSRQSAYSIQTRGMSNTLDYHGFTDEDIEDAKEQLVAVGGLRDHYNSRAYSYWYVKVPGYLVEALSDGLEKMERGVMNRVEDYCEEDPYLNRISDVTRGDNNLFRKQVGEEIEETDLEKLIQHGTVVLKYRSGRSSTGRRSSLPSRTEAVLSPSVRQIVGNASYRREVE